MQLQTATGPSPASLGDEARRICQALLRMDTTNPPGNERICADYLAGLLAEVGYTPELLEAAPPEDQPDRAASRDRRQATAPLDRAPRRRRGRGREVAAPAVLER